MMVKPIPCRKRSAKNCSMVCVIKINKQQITKKTTPPSSTFLRPKRSDNGPRNHAKHAPPRRKNDMEDGAHALLTPNS